MGSSYMAVDPGSCCVSKEDGTVIETREGKTRIAAGERRKVDFAGYVPQTLLLCKQRPETVFGDQSSSVLPKRRGDSSASGTVYSAFRRMRKVQETVLVSDSQSPVA